ncbi:TPA: hypothetical protein N0F65_001621 [Lagenidium giganteum]|uniref:Amino acid permease/ SLC12A domain-containing protein n=1 Tax=Lagenidium giganteum TaxID=4803 RepID=A0AAV2YFX2_9STRA|nr:TPA: hypothetical protein N0F65_001621 [Lagenidium giganteum]
MKSATAIAPFNGPTHAFRTVRPPSIYVPGRSDVWLLGITTVIGGQYFSWNIGFSAGVYGYLIAYLLVGMAYVCFCCCTAEITGALPFAGGAYGLSRCTLGFFPAFLIGCCEAFEYIACVATTMISLAGLIVTMVPDLKGSEPWLWLLLYGSILLIQIRGQTPFWTCNFIIGVMSIGILVIYCIGCLPFVNIKKEALEDDTQLFIDGVRSFLKAFPFAAWFFTGVECLNLASNDVDHPKVTIPRAQVACVSTLFLTGIMTFFTTVSIPTDGGIPAIASAAAPLNKGFLMMFNISSAVATLLSVPATYGVAFGFVWGYSKLIHSMASSKLIPPVFATTNKRYNTYHVAVIAGAVVGYCVCLVVYFQSEVASYVFSVCLMFAFMSYTGQCIGYISLKVNYRKLEKSKFQSPFGIVGAVYAIIIWVLGIISIAFFQDSNYIELASFLVIIIGVTIFYHVYSRRRQVFSDEENKVLLVAHVMKFNKKIKRRSSFSSTKNSAMPSSRGSVPRAAQRTGNSVREISHGYDAEAEQV